LRPDVNINNRPINISGSGNRAVIGSGNRAGNWNRSHYHHGGWNHSGWRPWYRHPATWVAGAATAGWLLSPGYAYSNPFYVAPTTIVEPALDYSQPIAVPPPVVEQTVVVTNPEPDVATAAAAVPAETTPAAQGQPVPEEVTRLFDGARSSFQSGAYQKALDQVDQAVAKLPGDPVLHEFRGLTLFAMKRYAEAAATDYAVLSAGPGWNWDTMKSLYPNEKTYTDQLRALEAYQREHPQSADGHFLLAYHYLVLDHPDQAVKQLEQVAKLLPNDKLAPEMVKALKEPAEERPNPSS
jgi:TolA-binding protein